MIMKMICFLSLCVAVLDSKVCSSSKGVVVCCQGYVWNKIENRCIPQGFKLSTLLWTSDIGYSSTFVVHTKGFNVTESTRHTNITTSKSNSKKKNITSKYFKYIFSILVVAAVLFVIYIVVIIRYK